VIEIPKGSRDKYQHDEAAEPIVLARFISSSTVYPTDYGYVKPPALFKMRDEAGSTTDVGRLVAGRPAETLARRVVPRYPDVPAVLPIGWLA
jgi:Inorganic pyrophosphatase